MYVPFCNVIFLSDGTETLMNMGCQYYEMYYEVGNTVCVAVCGT